MLIVLKLTITSLMFDMSDRSWSRDAGDVSKERERAYYVRAVSTNAFHESQGMRTAVRTFRNVFRTLKVFPAIFFAFATTRDRGLLFKAGGSARLNGSSLVKGGPWGENSFFPSGGCIAIKTSSKDSISTSLGVQRPDERGVGSIELSLVVELLDRAGCGVNSTRATLRDLK